MFSVRDALEESVSRVKNGDGNFRPVEILRQPRMMALAGFAEEHRADRASRAQRLFYQARALHPDGAGFRCQAAAQRHAEFLEPLVVARGDHRNRRTGSAFAWCFGGGRHSACERSRVLPIRGIRRCGCGGGEERWTTATGTKKSRSAL